MADLKIGLTAYLVVGNLAFVKVPSERGRYMLTDLCVVAVPCPVCEAIVGEPCRRFHGLRYWDRLMPGEKPLAHGVGVHFRRRDEAKKKYGRGYAKRIASHYRLHVAAGDVEAALADAPEPEHTPEPINIDVPVTRRQEG